MELDERSRQLGEVSRQLCEVGSVGRASAARLYAAGNAATAGKETGIEKVSRPMPAARIAGRRPLPGSPTVDSGQPVEIGRSPEDAYPAKILRTVFRGNCEARLETRGSRRRIPQNRYDRHSRYARHVGSTTGSTSAAPRAGSVGATRPGVDRPAAPRAARRQPAGSAARRQHHGAGSVGPILTGGTSATAANLLDSLSLAALAIE
jgi:hypothetical protein